MNTKPDTLSELISGFRGIVDRGIIFYDRNIEFQSYDCLYRMAVEKCNYLQSQGVGRGNKVIVCLNTEFENITFLFSLFMLGAVPVSIKPSDHYSNNYSDYVRKIARYQAADYIASNLEVDLHLKRIDVTGRISDGGHNFDIGIDQETVAFIQYSSGSTSSPKAIPLTHRAILHNLRQIVSIDRRCAQDVGLNVLPICHDMGLMGGLLSNFIYYNRLILVETNSFLRNPVRVLSVALKENVVVTAFSNMMLDYMERILSIKNNLPAVFSSIKNMYIGAEPIRKTSVDKFIARARRYGLSSSSLIFSYGLAEAVLIVSAKRVTKLDDCFDNSISGVYVANTGCPVGGIEIAIHQPNRDGVGNIMIRGASLFSGYNGETDHVGQWFDTGDLGYMKRGELYISGRKKELIIVGGENYYANDIEEYLYSNFDLTDCLAIQSSCEFVLLYSTKRSQEISIDAINQALSGQFGITPNRIMKIKPVDFIRTSSGKPIRELTLKNI